MKPIRKLGKFIYYHVKNFRKIFVTNKVIRSKDNIKYLCSWENQIERSIIETGLWEKNETKIIKKTLKRGDVVFDIGANVGYFSLLISKIIGDSGQVHCFEPTDYAYSKLLYNMNLNKNLPISNIKLNKNGLASTSDIRLENIESKFSSKTIAHNIEEIVNFITLDDYCKISNITKVNFIKIDVDGYDLDVIKGGAFIFKTYKPIVLAELCNRVLIMQNTNIEEYINLYLEYGYDEVVILETMESLSLRYLLTDKRMTESTWNVLLKNNS